MHNNACSESAIAPGDPQLPGAKLVGAGRVSESILSMGTIVGGDPERDRARGFTVTDSGITVLGKGQPVTPD